MPTVKKDSSLALRVAREVLQDHGRDLADAVRVADESRNAGIGTRQFEGGPRKQDSPREAAFASSGGKVRLAAVKSRGPIASWGIERIRPGRLMAYTEVVHAER
jgi:hypothetical protein